MPKAIQNFQKQTYPNRELLIVADGVDVRDLLPNEMEFNFRGPAVEDELSPAGGRTEIRLIHVEDGRTIGEKRNFGCVHARGSIVLHWDDDDHSEPERIADQVARLIESGKAVTGYSRMLFTDGAAWWRYLGVSTLGTSLCYLKSWHETHKFPPKQVGEDGEFVEMARAAGQLHTVDAGRIMWASIHAANTSPRYLSSDIWKKLAGFPDE